jgi:DNA-binding transcriptional ArsR family regulator
MQLAAQPVGSCLLSLIPEAENPDGPVYSKSLKTVYRHLNILEKAGLVKIAGHRKYPGSRQTEKLCCRTATVFFQEREAEEKWWETEEGKQNVTKIGELALNSLTSRKKGRKRFRNSRRNTMIHGTELYMSSLKELPIVKSLPILWAMLECFESRIWR